MPGKPGEFAIDVFQDESAQDQTYLVSSFTGKIAVTRTTPAVVIVADAQTP